MSGIGSWSCTCGAANDGGVVCGACGKRRFNSPPPNPTRSPMAGPAGTAAGAGLAALSVLAMGLMVRPSSSPRAARPQAIPFFPSSRVPAGYPPPGGSVSSYLPPATLRVEPDATETPRRTPAASSERSGSGGEIPPPVGLYSPPFDESLPSLATPTAPPPVAPVRPEPAPVPGVPPGQAIIARVRASVVKVFSAAPAADRRGTGFVVAPHLVLTCAHLVRSTSGVTIVLADGRQAGAVVERLDALNDLALLSTSADLPPALPIDETGQVEPGESVAVTGFPDLGDGASGDLTVTGALAGWVTRPSPSGERVEMLQLFADIRPGHSGGPVYSLRDGRVFGVTSFRITGSQTIGYATGGPMVRQFLSSPRPAPGEGLLEN